MIKLRAFDKSDAKILADWLSDKQTYALICGEKFGAFPLSEKDIIAYYKQYAETSFGLICECGNSPVGHIMISGCGDSRLVSSIVISKEQRGKGLGRQMLCLAADYCFKILNACYIEIGVFEKNLGALKLYISLNFIPVQKTQRNYLSNPSPYLMLRLYKGDFYEHL